MWPREPERRRLLGGPLSILTGAVCARRLMTGPYFPGGHMRYPECGVEAVAGANECSKHGSRFAETEPETHR